MSYDQEHVEIVCVICSTQNKEQLQPCNIVTR